MAAESREPTRTRPRIAMAPPATASTCPVLPEAVDIFDTTLRDGSQQEGLSLTVDDKLRVAEQLDHLGVAFIEGGLAGRQPQGRGVLRPGPGRAAAVDRHPGGLRLDPARRGARRGRRGAAPPGEGQHRGGVHRGQGVGAARHRGPAHHARRGRGDGGRARWPSCATTTSGCSSTPSTSSTATATTPSSRLRVLRAAEEAGAEALVLCDTNGGTLPHDVERIVAGIVADFECQVGVHFHNDSGCAVANSIAGGPGRGDPRPGVRQRLRRAHRQRRSLGGDPQPVAEAATSAPSRPTASSASRRSRTTSPSS